RGNALIGQEELRPYYVQFLKDAMNISKQYQRKLLEGVRVAYCGIEGAFAHMAAMRLFPDANPVAYEDFKAAYSAVEAGECDVAVLPLENSFAGEVGTVMDIMFGGNLYVNDLRTLQVEHCLLGAPGAQMSDVTTVMSHPQALAQCAGYIERKGYRQVQSTNTALAAKDVAERGDKTLAAIASTTAAKLYGLEVLESNINESESNSTRFGVFSRTRSEKPRSSKSDHILLMFTVKNEAGALAKAINVIGAYGYNMSVVRSRPMKSLAWQYYFYIEANGDGTRGNEERMITALQATCDKLKVLGSFDWKEQ
ncbi:MAG: bifunctional chorismate mutase/prephenate dehydratase, partial [Lachnospiraceae bacterium]|nr:bifunctional chorismate mutase/prephenate dehydratase [Lachnospiraceae bacterium]